MPDKKRILIVDDEADYAEILRDRLDFEGYEVTLARNGAEGFAALKEGEFDAVLVDLMMPEVNGFELIERIRKEDGALSKIPVAVVTAYGDLFSEEKRRSLGDVTVIHKPYDIKLFLKELKDIAERKR